MTKKEKLFKRLLELPKDLRFEELDKILVSVGYVLERTRGSHAIYTKSGANTLTIPRKSPVKSYLIQQVLEEIGDTLENTTDGKKNEQNN